MGLFSPSKPSGGPSTLRSAAIATLGGAQISLTLLEKMTDGVPVPFVKAAAATAVEVIKMARVIYANRKECDDLIGLSSSLLVVILASLDGKTEHDIPSHLRGAVERLTSNFHEVLAELNVLRSRAGKEGVRSKLKAGLYHFDNADKLKECSAKLDWALQEFQVTSKIDSCLKDLERHEELRKELKEGQAELHSELRDGRTEIREGQKEILEAVKEKTIVSVLSSLPSTVMPANPKIFGRQDYVAAAVNLIISNSSAQLAILGPGGMGKTSVALKIAHDTRVIDRFGKNCHWVPCEQATSLNLLVELLAKSLNLPASTSNDRFGDIVTSLESSVHPHLLFLDNFETPWDIPGEQSNVADILSRLGAISSTSFVLTMRGSQHPASDRVDWSHPRLPLLHQLRLAAARDAFLRIAPDVASDPRLDTLLEELDCMPLAITLMAKLAETGEKPSQLLLQWRSERTRLLAQPEGDRRNSIEISIKLSMESRSVKAHSEAINLLGILAVLPAGAYLVRLPDICHSIPNWRTALRVLNGAALVYDGADKQSVHVLSPIRSYVLLYHPLQGAPLYHLQKTYCDLAAKGRSEPGDADFVDSSTELKSEKANLETILMDALSQPAKEQDWIIEASLNYSWFLYWTQPQAHIITAAVNAARSSGSNLLARCLQVLGNILLMQSKYDNAYIYLETARAEFLTLGNMLQASMCLKVLGQIRYFQSNYDEAYSLLETARADFVKIGSLWGANQCLRATGDILYSQGKYDAAISALETSMAEYLKLGDPSGANQCLKIIGLVLLAQNNLSDAQSYLEKSRAGYTALGNMAGVADCSRILGDVQIALGKYDEAFPSLEEARAAFIYLGQPRGTALSLASLGVVSRHLRKYDLAISQLQEAYEMLSSLPEEDGAANCEAELELARKEKNSSESNS